MAIYKTFGLVYSNDKEAYRNRRHFAGISKEKMETGGSWVEQGNSRVEQGKNKIGQGKGWTNLSKSRIEQGRGGVLDRVGAGVLGVWGGEGR